jgi:pimeloyl-ACP methyl ester carboxylesterase
VTFVPSFDRVQAPGSTPARVGFLLHGILGSARNWRTFARRLAAATPDVAWAVVDLRNHGESQGAPSPHTVTTTADDLVQVANQVGKPAIVVGHSFGGKVAVRFAERHPEGVQRVWVLDSRLDAEPPGTDNEVALVVDALHAVALPVADRQEVAHHLLSRGFSPSLAQWMTTNLRREGDGFIWAFDLGAVQAMIDDYWRLDLMPVLADPPCRIDLVRAGRSDRWPPEILDRIAAVSAPRVAMHVLPDSGHWVHVDDPEGLLRLLAAGTM